MTLLNDGWIAKFGKEGGIEPFNTEHVNPASYDISVGSKVVLYKPSSMIQHSFNNVTPNIVMGLKKEEHNLEQYSHPVLLKSGERAFIHTREIIKTPVDVAVQVQLKSSLIRSMIVSQMGLIDPGYEGAITLYLINMGTEDYELKFGRRVAQFIFEPLNEPAVVPYGDPRRKSHYQGSVGITPNKSTL